MRRLPWLTTALGTAALLLVVLVPAAMAKPASPPEGQHGGKVCSNAPSNPHCYPVAQPGGGTTSEFHPCKDNTPPPCAAGKDFSAPLRTAIPTGGAFLAVGALVLGYLGWHRRQALRLNA